MTEGKGRKAGGELPERWRAQQKPEVVLRLLRGEDSHTPLLTHLASTWSLPDLPSRIHLAASTRMTRALARAYPATGRISISARALRHGSEDLLREILCHEAAHIAVFMKHGGRRVRPHGREWQELVRQAGYEPRVRMPAGAGLPAAAVQRRPRAYTHHCPVCGWTQVKRTTNRRWRCATCVASGRSGLLEVKTAHALRRWMSQ